MRFFGSEADLADDQAGDDCWKEQMRVKNELAIGEADHTLDCHGQHI